jgi:ABC-type uncharacterized transport system permease subunit
LYGRALFFAVILGVFAALWRAVAEAGMPLRAGQDQLVWYLAATEWILLSTPQRHTQIQDDVRRGDVAYQLPRPVSYPRAALAQCLGALLVRAPLLGVVAFGSAFAFTGRVPALQALLWLWPFGLLASAILAELYVALGLLAPLAIGDVPEIVVNESTFMLATVPIMRCIPPFDGSAGFPAPAGLVAQETESCSDCRLRDLP